MRSELVVCHSFDDVKHFHEHFGLVGLASPAFFPDQEAMKKRLDFIKEEFTELNDAYMAKDLSAFFDALLDMEYVIHGLTYMCKLPYHEGWKLVHDSNLLKEWSPEALSVPAIERYRYKIQKPEGWSPPDLKGLLVRYGWKE